MRSRSALFLIVLGFVVASCGVSREGATSDPDVAAEESGSDATDTATDDTSDADGSDDAAATTTSEPPVAAPATTAPDGDVAVTLTFADGSTEELLHGELNDIVGPTQANTEFVNLVYQGAVPPGFEAVVLSQTVLGEVMDRELSELDIEASDANLDEAKSLLFDQLQPLLAASTDPLADAERLYDEVPYLSFIANLQARQIALASEFAGSAEEGIGNPCVRHILLDEEAAAVEVLEELNGGADFAELAAERSVGPTGPNGGDLGCAPSTGYVAEFAAAVDEAETGAYVGPVQTEFGWHVIVVDSYEVNGDQLAQERLTADLNDTSVAVDERVGVWDPTRLTIVPAGS